MNANTSDSFRYKAQQFMTALTRLREVVALPEDSVTRDAMSQRFEFTYEMAWKTLRSRLLLIDIDARSPKEVLKRALVQGWLDDAEGWSRLHEMRNLTSHTYAEATAIEVAGFVRTQGVELFGRLAEGLTAKPPEAP